MAYQERLLRFSDARSALECPVIELVLRCFLENRWEGTNYSVPGLSNLTFTDDLLRYLSENLCIDHTRIYAVRKSLGGGFVNLLACSAQGSYIAAFAPVLGAFCSGATGKTCHRARLMIPMMEFHGDIDTVISYEGAEGNGGPLPDIGKWLPRWARRNGCTPDSKKVGEKYEGLAQHTVYSCGSGKKGLMQRWKIAGWEHNWPSIEPTSDTDRTTVIEATAKMMKWFEKWHL